MTSKKKLKKKIKKQNKKIIELQEISMGSLWLMTNIIQTYDNNMELIQKTFETVAEKVNDIIERVEVIEEKLNPLELLDEDTEKEEDGTG